MDYLEYSKDLSKRVALHCAALTDYLNPSIGSSVENDDVLPLASELDREEQEELFFELCRVLTINPLAMIGLLELITHVQYTAHSAKFIAHFSGSSVKTYEHLMALIDNSVLKDTVEYKSGVAADIKWLSMFFDWDDIETPEYQAITVFKEVMELTELW